MSRRLELVAQFESASSRQREAGRFYREFLNAGLPLFAETYRRECESLAPLIIGALEELTAMDRAEKAPRV